MKYGTGAFHLGALLFAWLFSVTAAAASVETERANIQQMRTETLERLYREQPWTRDDIQNAAGYAVFSSVGVHIAFLSGSGGMGLAHDNRSGRETYMNMAAAGVGLGLGIKDFRVVFVFHTPGAYKQFIEQGWDFSGQADAAAKSTGRGDEGSVAATVVPNVTVYQLTETGIALQVGLQGTRYWSNAKLNNPYR